MMDLTWTWLFPFSTWSHFRDCEGSDLKYLIPIIEWKATAGHRMPEARGSGEAIPVCFQTHVRFARAPRLLCLKCFEVGSLFPAS